MNDNQESIYLREVTPADGDHLREFLYHAIFVPTGGPRPRNEIVDQPELARLIQGWGQANDAGYLAVDSATGRVIGVAWYRLLTGENRGYGYVDDLTPELSIALLPGYRGRGIGSRLLSMLLETAAKRFSAVSLSVDPANPAVRLYERFGFRRVGMFGTSLVMKRDFRDG